MASMAEWEDRIKPIFTNKEYSEEGIFEVNMWHYGEPVKVTIDDSLPSRSSRGFSPVALRQGRNGGWWGPLLEKAAAKYYGTYENMSGGMMDEAFYALTGSPSITVQNSRERDLWGKLQKWEKNHYMMSSANFQKAYGLVAGHAYTTVGVHTYNGEKLVAIRNPWGREKYNGPWSDRDSSKWTAAARAALKHTNKNDGLFYMPYDLYRRVFKLTIVSEYRDWKRTTKQVHFSGGTNELRRIRYTITNPVQQDVSLGVLAPSVRHMRDK